MTQDERTSLVQAGPTPPKLLIERRTAGPLTCLRLSGTLDEQFDGPGLARTIAGRWLVLDLGGIDRISSFGIRQWMDLIADAQVDCIYFVECSPKVVDQFNMVANFGGNGQIVSFYAPYRCESCDHDRRRLFRTDEETSLWRAGQAPAFSCQICGNPEYFDEDPATYFSYVAQQTPPPLPLEVASFLKSELSYGQGGQRKLKIEKRIDGRTTYIRLSGDLDSDLRAQKLAEGLEGDVAFDLAAVLSIDPVGAAQWRKLLSILDQNQEGSAVDWVHLVGVPPVFLDRLGRPEDLTRKGQVLSVQVPYTCPRCRATTQRLVDFVAHGHELRAGRVPRTQCGACSNPATCVATETWLSRLATLPQPQIAEPLRQSIVRLSMAAIQAKGGTVGITVNPGPAPMPAPASMRPPLASPAGGIGDPRPLDPPQSGPTAGQTRPLGAMDPRDSLDKDTRPLPAISGLLQRLQNTLSPIASRMAIVRQIPGLVPSLLVVCLALSAAVVYRILTPQEGRVLPGGWTVVETSQQRPPAWNPLPTEPIFLGESPPLPDRHKAQEQAEETALSELARRLSESLSQREAWKAVIPPLYEASVKASIEKLRAAEQEVKDKKPGAEERLASTRLSIQESRRRVALLMKAGLRGSTAPLPTQFYWEKRIRGERKSPKETTYVARAFVELSAEAYKRLVEHYGTVVTLPGSGQAVLSPPMVGWSQDLSGAVILSVESSSPLAQAGLTQGDLVVSVAGREIGREESASTELREALERGAEKPEGAKIALKVQKQERLLDITLTFPRKTGKRPPEPGRKRR